MISKEDIFARVYGARDITPEELVPRRERFEWKDMEKAAAFLMAKLVEEDLTIGVLYDPDVDGLLSGYLMEDYLIRLNYQVKRHMNKDKVHGLQEEAVQWVKDEELDVVIVVDAGSGDTKSINELVKMGKTVLVLDHHDYEEAPIEEGGLIVNATNHEEIKHISGCAVVYYFLEELDKVFEMGVEQYEKYVGVTILSDICSMRTNENRYFVTQAYDAINLKSSPLFTYFKFWGSYSSYVSYNLVPYLNAMIRCNMTEEAMELTDYFGTTELQQKMREFGDVRKLQRQKVEKLQQIGTEVKLKGLTILIRKKQEDADENYQPFNGLVANQILGRDLQSALVLEYNEVNEEFAGSFRGVGLVKADLEEWGFTCQGHDQACGVRVSKEGLGTVLNEFESDAEQEIVIDLKVKSDFLSESILEEIAWFNEYYGKDLPHILIEFTDEPKQIHRGQKKDEYEFEDNRVVIDFGRGVVRDKYIVQPLLRFDTYQLIRR